MEFLVDYIVPIVAYAAVTVAFIPFCCQTSLEGWEEERGEADFLGRAASLFGGVCLACCWPILAVVWLANR